MPRDDEKVVPGSEQALDRFKWEVAEDLGLAGKVREIGWENMTTGEVGKIGGHMVKQMISAAEESLKRADQPPTPPRGELAEQLYESPYETEGLSGIQSEVAWHQRPPRLVLSGRQNPAD